MKKSAAERTLRLMPVPEPTVEKFRPRISRPWQPKWLPNGERIGSFRAYRRGKDTGVTISCVDGCFHVEDGSQTMACADMVGAVNLVESWLKRVSK
jgi:hypothetical protein